MHFPAESTRCPQPTGLIRPSSPRFCYLVVSLPRPSPPPAQARVPLRCPLLAPLQRPQKPLPPVATTPPLRPCTLQPPAPPSVVAVAVNTSPPHKKLQSQQRRGRSEARSRGPPLKVPVETKTLWSTSLPRSVSPLWLPLPARGVAYHHFSRKQTTPPMQRGHHRGRHAGEVDGTPIPS